MIQRITKEPEKILRHKAIPVVKVDDGLQPFIDDMIETMHAAEGVGLAANQIDDPRHIFVASADGVRGEELTLINAKITKSSGKETSPEGCLSLPGVHSEVTRAAEVTVQGLDREGNEVTIDASGLLAKIFQHELDHLNGKLYIDHLNFFSRHKILNQYRELRDATKDIKL